jgi:DNA replication protein DnaC
MNTKEHLSLQQRLQGLRLYGCIASLSEIQKDELLSQHLIEIVRVEEQERQRRLLKNRISATRIRDLEPVVGFDWNWPSKIDKTLIKELLTFEFLKQKTNVVFLGTAGLGKTMLAQNLVHEAARKGYSAVFIEAVDLLNQLRVEDSRSGLDRLLKKFAKPDLLAIDEVGYLSYAATHGDLLLRVIHMRHKTGSTVVTTNRPFSEWIEMFPNAASVTALVDRLTENCEVVQIEGKSYRGKRALERKQARADKKKSTVASQDFTEAEA